MILEGVQMHLGDFLEFLQGFPEACEIQNLYEGVTFLLVERGRKGKKIMGKEYVEQAVR